MSNQTEKENKILYTFFGCASSKLKEKSDVYLGIVDEIAANDAVLARYWVRRELEYIENSAKTGGQIERSETVEEIYESVMDSLNDCNIAIFEGTVKSMSVGHQLSYALSRSKPALLLFNESEVDIDSLFVSANKSGYLHVKPYSSLGEMKKIVSDFIKKYGHAKKVRINLALPEHQAQFLKEESIIQNISKTRVIQDAIDLLMQKKYSAYKKHVSTNPYLQKVRSHTSSYEVNFLDFEITVFPNVMSPEYDWSPTYYANALPDQKGKTLLDVGCGCGVIGLYAARKRAKNVVAIDINPDAVENTKHNIEKLNLTNMEALESDLFTNVLGLYDSVFFNTPYHGDKPTSFLEMGVSDHGYKTLKRFFGEVGAYLNSDGHVYLGFSNTGDVKLLEKLISRNKFEIIERKERVDDWTAYLYILKKSDS